VQPQKVRFADLVTERPAPRGIDVFSILRHFAIITYAVEPERLRPLIHPRFELLTIEVGGSSRALISIVPFEELEFRLALSAFPRFRMAQTNYRVYVYDTKNNEACVWFIGSLLDSPSVVVPRYLWKLPWHYGRMRFDCEVQDGRYSHYKLETRSTWGEARLTLHQEAGYTRAHTGFTDEESALAYLTHPLTGYYYRRDGRLGSYKVWHDRLQLSPAQVQDAHFTVLERLGIVTPAEQLAPYSVMVQPQTEFTIYLPPGLA
jgi:uncharacterized protein YqjF (DUF2071 family)